MIMDVKVRRIVRVQKFAKKTFRKFYVIVAAALGATLKNIN